MAKMMLQMMGAFAEMELDMIKVRQREAIAIAKKEGRQIGRKAKLNASSIEPIKALWISGKNKLEIAKEMEVSRVTFYALLKKYDVALDTQSV